MSFREYRELIAEGDTVILYINVHSMYALEVRSYKRNRNDELVENVFQTNYGALRVISLVGKKFGTKVQLSRGWAYILHPTPEFWTLTLPHRTQIIYSLDSSIIVQELELRPGSVVIECGTGSGSMSHALIRTILPTGHLYTFDFHNERVIYARNEFRRHDLEQCITVGHRDVCLEGFGPELDTKADAVFLDIPHPWEALLHVPRAFKITGNECAKTLRNDFPTSTEVIMTTTEELLRSTQKNVFKTLPNCENLVSGYRTIYESLNHVELVHSRRRQELFRPVIPEVIETIKITCLKTESHAKYHK